MNDKYLSEGFEGDIPTKPCVKKTTSRIVFLPKGIPIPLIALLVCISSHVCSKASAEQQAILVLIDALIERIEAKTPDTAKALQTLLDSFQLGRIREIVGRMELMEYWSSRIRYSL
jgi:hypothetical protein